ncbi:MAG: ABC transporter ATP-binding protein [Methanobrevibacter thaueri]|nr:ABC transporter ATP-binding protein [Methanobrevibacter thaueri]
MSSQLDESMDKPVDTRKAIKNIIFLLKDYKLKLIITVICAVISTLFDVIGPLLIGKALTIIYEGVINIINHTGNFDFGSFINILIIAFILYIVSSIFAYLQNYILINVTTEISYNLRKEILEKITHLSMKQIDENKRGDILSRITNDVDSLQSGITQSFLQLITAVITLVGITVVMITINIWMALATLTLVPITFLVIRVITNRSQKYFSKELEYRGSLNGQIEENFTGIDIIQIFNQEEDSINKFNQDNEKMYNYEWKSEFISSLNSPSMELISNIQYVIIAVLGAVFALQKAITVGDILAFFQYIEHFTRPIQQITKSMTTVQIAMAASERIFEFLELNEEENNSEKIIKNINENITFENINFSYDSDKKIIDNLSFKVNKGDKIAIVGETGAGKTTIVKLLMRFYDVDSGEIKIDGVNINEYDKHSLRSLVGMVLQDSWIFNDTILNNIRYGKLDASDEEIIKISKQIYADEFIMQLPDSYESVISEDCDNISHGQKQLITIARTILSQKEILILDEATSSVDTKTEELIQIAMDELMKNKTSFIIAHRLSTIKNADKIIVISDGKIIEAGCHEELIAKKGYYYQTLNIQSQQF